MFFYLSICLSIYPSIYMYLFIYQFYTHKKKNTTKKQKQIAVGMKKSQMQMWAWGKMRRRQRQKREIMNCTEHNSCSSCSKKDLPMTGAGFAGRNEDRADWMKLIPPSHGAAWPIPAGASFWAWLRVDSKRVTRVIVHAREETGLFACVRRV